MVRKRPAHLARSSRTRLVRQVIGLGIGLVVLVAGVVVAVRHDDGKPAAHAVAGSSSSAAPTTAASTPASASGPPGTADATQTFTISAVGDTMLGKDGTGPPNPATYFSSVESDLRGDAQIVFGNLEGTLSDVSGSKCDADPSDCFAFQVPPRFAHYLAGAGFTVLNTANNHSHDFGEAGFEQTVDAIHGAGMVETGRHGQVMVVNAGSIRVAFVGFAPYRETASMLDLPAARALVRQARQQSDVVVAYMHAGAEGTDAQHVTGQEETYVGEDRGNAQEFAHLAIDEGASLVLGSGPHVLRGVEFYKGHLIAYSLGNFAGYSNFNTSGVQSNSAILHVTLNGAGEYLGGRIIPIALTAKNQPMPGGSAVSMMARLSQEDFGSAAPHFAGDGTITPP